MGTGSYTKLFTSVIAHEQLGISRYSVIFGNSDALKLSKTLSAARRSPQISDCCNCLQIVPFKALAI